MNGSNMENEKTPLYVAFSTQKGGVGGKFTRICPLPSTLK